MIVFNLRCGSADHVFEAWFGSSEAYEDQRSRHLISCPVCGDSAIDKAVMAPNVSAKSNARTGILPEMAQTPSPDQVRTFIEKMASGQAQLLKNSVWVGKDFTEKARAMHFDEIARETIHGEATVKEAQSMIEDGIELLPLPLPVIPPEAQN